MLIATRNTLAIHRRRGRALTGSFRLVLDGDPRLTGHRRPKGVGGDLRDPAGVDVSGASCVVGSCLVHCFRSVPDPLSSPHSLTIALLQSYISSREPTGSPAAYSPLAFAIRAGHPRTHVRQSLQEVFRQFARLQVPCDVLELPGKLIEHSGRLCRVHVAEEVSELLG